MPVKTKTTSTSITNADAMPSVRKAKARAARIAPPASERVGTGEMLRQIRVRGDQLSSEIEKLLVRLG